MAEPHGRDSRPPPKSPRATPARVLREAAYPTSGASVESVFEHCGAVATGLTQHRCQSRDDVERLAALHHPLQLAELFLEPLDVDRRSRRAEYLRMRGRPDRLALRPLLPVQLH